MLRLFRASSDNIKYSNNPNAKRLKSFIENTNKLI